MNLEIYINYPPLRVPLQKIEGDKFRSYYRKWLSLKQHKTQIFALLFMLCLSSVLAQITNNKGNRNQAYPVITETNPQVVTLINNVQQNNLESSIRYLQGFIRKSNLPAALTVQNWLVDKCESFGYSDISIHYFTLNSVQLDAGNVVVVKYGSEFPNEFIFVQAHYDHNVGPGADDNASGTAGVLECARLLKDFPTKRSIAFLFYNAEEDGLIGSDAFAKKCAAENKNIIAVFNMDMIGWFPPGNPNTIMATGYSYISKSLFNYFMPLAALYVPAVPFIRLTKGDSAGSDHLSFNKNDYPALAIGDTEYIELHPCYHKPCDTLGNGVNRLDLAKTFVQSTLAAAAELANAWFPPQNLSACSSINSIKISWDNSPESSSYKVYKNKQFLTEVNQNFYIDYDIILGNKYEYYVIAKHQSTGKESAPSNVDEVTFVAPLSLPYFNNFFSSKYGFEQSDWAIIPIQGVQVITNRPANNFFSFNYLSIAESDWFAIPNGTENISVNFKMQQNYNGRCTQIYFEVTNDRKTWHKLANLTSNSSFKTYQFSLNDFICSEFVQIRFRIQCCGESNINNNINAVYVTDVKLWFEPINVEEYEMQENYMATLSFTPNPANNYINIKTEQDTSYTISIYDMSGKVIFAQQNFTDGNLDISQLQKGIYLIVGSTKTHHIAKKLIKL